jgi:hypothetical protein
MREPGKIVAATIYKIFLYIENRVYPGGGHEVRTYTSQSDVCGRGVASANRV